MVITPHYNVSGASPTPQVLADGLANQFQTWLVSFAPITVKLYEEDGLPPPHYPVATSTKNVGGGPVVSTAPREIALCLSYYQTHNVPRYRGRLYTPLAWINKNMSGGGTPSARPTSAHQNSVKALASALQGAAAGAQWGFWSRRDKNFRAITNYYVDDEWDTIRKRGLKPTSRVTGTIP
jgi:hypothetical protein